MLLLNIVVFAQVATLINVLMIEVSDNTKRFNCQNVPIRSISPLQIPTIYFLKNLDENGMFCNAHFVHAVFLHGMHFFTNVACQHVTMYNVK